MMYFKCMGCDVKLTKLIADGCPICASPCQVVDDVPPMNWIRNGENAGPFTHSPVVRRTLARVEVDETSTDSIISDLDDLYIDGRYNDHERAWKISEQKHIDVLEDTTAMQRSKRELNLTEAVNDDTNDDSLAFQQLGKPISNSCILLASSVNKPPRLSPGSQIEKGIVKTKQRAIASLAGADSSSIQSEITTKDKPVLISKEQGSNKLQPLGKKKKKPRTSRHQRRNVSSTAETKVYAQLELPEPILSPGMSNGASGWSDVVGKGSVKAAKKLQNNTAKRLNERDFVNASSYLTRDSESELPSRERAAIDVRFGMGSAKHGVRRVVPRSALE